MSTGSLPFSSTSPDVTSQTPNPNAKKVRSTCTLYVPLGTVRRPCGGTQDSTTGKASPTRSGRLHPAQSLGACEDPVPLSFQRLFALLVFGPIVFYSPAARRHFNSSVPLISGPDRSRTLLSRQQILSSIRPRCCVFLKRFRPICTEYVLFLSLLRQQ